MIVEQALLRRRGAGLHHSELKKHAVKQALLLARERGITFGDPLGGVSINQGMFAVLFFVSHARKTKIAAEVVAPALIDCRGGGIRTPGSREGSPVFETGTLSHSVTPLCV